LTEFLASPIVDPHRGNLLKTSKGHLALIDFGMVVDIDEDFRYSLFGLVIGLQNKDLSLVTENLLKLGFLKDTTQLDVLVPRLRQALKNASGGTGKASDVNFAQLQAELDEISRENVLRFTTPAYFTVIIRSLTILEGVALSVDKNFRLVRGAYPYVLSQLLNPEDSGRQPEALQKLLVRLLTVNGQGEEIEWEQLRDFLRLAQKASKAYDPSLPESQVDDKASISRKTLELFGKFMTSRTGVFLKKPLVHVSTCTCVVQHLASRLIYFIFSIANWFQELAEAIDGMASIGEASLLRLSRGLVPALPGMNGPVNMRRMDEISGMLATFRDALISRNSTSIDNLRSLARIETIMDIIRAMSSFLSDERLRQDAEPLLEELQSVIQMVAVEILEIRGSRAMRAILRV
jgi:ABC1 atypical kinase-like domain